jgi:hypothetical protein
MNTNLRNRISQLAIATLATVLGATQTSNAVPVLGRYVDDPRCDTLPITTLTHELGLINPFPLNEALEINFQPTQNTVCVPQDGLANDWNVQIRNLSGIAWTDVHMVVDLGAQLGNSDGVIEDVANAPGIFTDAMRIDSLGINNNLFFESGPVNNILDIGETWRFNVSNFNNNAALNQPPIFVTPGKFAGSSPLGPGNNGNASILANPVPEPGVISVVLGGAAALLLRRPRRA